MIDNHTFLFSNQLISELEKLIKNSKNKLLLISPYIDLDERIKDALKTKINNPNFELKILFGKNETDFFKSIKIDSLDFFKRFPNIEIRYNERLHAKFYQNDFDFIITSMNLYKYSLSNNIEVGVKVRYDAKSLAEKLYKNTDGLIFQVLDKISEEVFDTEKGANPVDEFESIFNDSKLKYKNIKGANKKDEFITKYENIPSSNQINLKSNIDISEKTFSTTHLAKQFKISSFEITNLMQKTGLIDKDKITELGESKGLKLKQYMGKDFISYPENLSEFNELKKGKN
mgnify:CR=1 FL=1